MRASERPRFRSDLVAQPIDEEGVRYVDVTDPLSGSTFRFYDVEYSIACAMDGVRDLDNLAEWTRVELGIEASTDELANVMNTLAELGYLENVPASSSDPSAPGVATDVGTVGWTDETAREVSSAYDEAMELGPPGRSPLEGARAAAQVEEVELGPAGGFDEEITVRPGGDSQAALAATVTATGSAGSTIPNPAPPPPAARTTGTPAPAEGAPAKPAEDELSFAGLLDEAEPAKPGKPAPAPREPAARQSASRPAEPASPATVTAAHSAAVATSTSSPASSSTAAKPEARTTAPHARAASRSGDLTLGDDEPTALPGTAAYDDEEDVSVDLSAHLQLNKTEVQEAIRSSRAFAVPELPKDLKLPEDEEPRQEAAMPLPAPTEAATPEPAPSAQQPTPVPVSATSVTPPAPMAAVAPPVEEPPTAPAAAHTSAVPLPEKPPMVARRPPVEPPRPPRAATGRQPSSLGSGVRPLPKKQSSSLGVVLFLLVLVVGAAGVYTFRERIFGGQQTHPRRGQVESPGSPTMAAGTAPTPTDPASGEVPLAPAGPGAATPAAEPQPELPTGEVRADEATGQTLAAPTDGTVAWTAEDPTVEAGEPVVKLAGFPKWESQLREGKERGAVYERRLAKATEGSDDAAIQAAERKVAEKKQMVEKAEAELAKLVVKAPADGPVEIVVPVGTRVKAGAPLARVGGAGKPQLRATFDVGADAARHAKGSACVVAHQTARDKQAACVIDAVAGDQVTVRILAGSPLGPGARVVLLPVTSR